MYVYFFKLFNITEICIFYIENIEKILKSTFYYLFIYMKKFCSFR